MDRRDCFWAGMIVAYSLSSLHQDALGKDKYIQFVQTEWVTGWWTVTLALVFLAVGIAAYVIGAKQDKAIAIPRVNNED